jgi:hypothetical protein
MKTQSDIVIWLFLGSDNQLMDAKVIYTFHVEQQKRCTAQSNLLSIFPPLILKMFIPLKYQLLICCQNINLFSLHAYNLNFSRTFFSLRITTAGNVELVQLPDCPL